MAYQGYLIKVGDYIISGKDFIKADSYNATLIVQDLLQEAFIGLYKAIEKYDSSEEVSFITYSLFWVKQSVKRYMEKCNDLHLPGYVLQMQYQYKKPF